MSRFVAKVYHLAPDEVMSTDALAGLIGQHPRVRWWGEDVAECMVMDAAVEDGWLVLTLELTP